jgi:DNA-binding transcriptional LysR family regulator
VAHRHAVQDELEAGALSASEIVEPRLVQKFYLARASDRTPSAAAQRVAQWITQWREVDEAQAGR